MIETCENLVKVLKMVFVIAKSPRGSLRSFLRKLRQTLLSTLISHHGILFHSYDNFQVPDTMNVHGIYDTTASMTVFTSRSEYRQYLERESGISGSVFGFYAGVKSAWGSSESGAQQTNLAIFDIDVDRYFVNLFNCFFR